MKQTKKGGLKVCFTKSSSESSKDGTFDRINHGVDLGELEIKLILKCFLIDFFLKISPDQVSLFFSKKKGATLQNGTCLKKWVVCY